MDRTVTPGSIWRHFKGTTAKVITLANHSETDELLVVYECSGNEGRAHSLEKTEATARELLGKIGIHDDETVQKVLNRVK